MYCKNCGRENKDDAQFCKNCGNKVLGTNTISAEPYTHKNQQNIDDEGIIKCGNCEYIGPGEPARRTISKILAWICVVFAPLITILYFVGTHKYRCPKCKSTFLGIKNKQGVFQGQRGGAGRAVTIFIVILVGIAILGILASVVLASLNSARQKGADASIKANLANLRAQAEIYWDSNSENGKDGSYSGLCDDTEITKIINSTPKVKDSGPLCNDSIKEYAVTSQLNSGGYFCVDSAGKAETTQNPLTTETTCTFLGISTPTTSSDWVVYNSVKDRFSVSFPVYPTVETEDESDYTYNTYYSESGNSYFFVASYIYDETVDLSNTDTILESMMNNFVEGSDGTLLSSNYSYLKTFRTLDFSVKNTDGFLQGRVLIANKIPFLLIAGSPDNIIGNLNTKKFLDSFGIK